jgi:hypothetical protein
MKWKFDPRDGGHSPHLVAWSDHDSKETTLDRSCDTRRHQLRVKVLFIEGPNGERIENPEIEKWCNAQGRAA